MIKIEVHHYIHYERDSDILGILRELQSKGVKVMESPEVAAFRESVSQSLDNLTEDITYLVNKVNENPGLSEEDKTTLADIQERAAALSAVFQKPE